jgi:hypothetical protein
VNRNHEAFFRTPEGQRLEAIIRQPYHRYGYLLMSLTQQPAINAATWELDVRILAMPSAKRGHAKQACGALVGEIMLKLDAKRAVTKTGRPRSARIRASRAFTMGAVWVVDANALKAAASPLSASRPG